MELNFKLKGEKVVFMSDLHINHDRDFIYEPRGFSSSHEHRDFIFDNWRKNIDNDTVVINLGDVCFRDQNGDIFFKHVSTLPCKQHLIVFGNHNSGVKQFLASEEMVAARPHVKHLGHYALCKIDSLIAALFHFPILIPDSSSKGSVCISGHSHGNCSFTNPNRSDFGKLGKIIDVGVECALEYTKRERFFFTLEEILDITSKVRFRGLDHHSKI